MEEYSAEFENLVIKEDLREAKEQSIARYLAGMRFVIINQIVLFHTLNTLGFEHFLHS